MRRAAATILAACVAVLALSACGVGAGDTPRDVRLTVTDGFGGRVLVQRVTADVSGSDTVMRLLQRNAKVTTRYGGGFVQSIDGLAGKQGSRPLDWFYFVNGVLAEKGAAATKVEPGDRIWWDRHDWSVTNTVPAVVGSFPEPFVHGPPGSDRLPIRVECDDTAEASGCRTAARKLADLGLVVGRSKLPTESGSDTLRVLVGLWPSIERDRAGAQLGRGPAASGVYAKPRADGKAIDLLDAGGRTVRTLGPGSGLIAATRYRDERPTWVLTGTDAAGVQAAAEALDERTLRNKYAVAVSGGQAISLPVDG